MPEVTSHDSGSFDYQAFSRGCMETILHNAEKQPVYCSTPSYCPGPVTRKRSPMACMYCDALECPYDLAEK